MCASYPHVTPQLHIVTTVTLPRQHASGIFCVITLAGILFTVITEYEMTVASCTQMSYCARVIYALNGLDRIQLMHIRQVDKRCGH